MLPSVVCGGAPTADAFWAYLYPRTHLLTLHDNTNNISAEKSQTPPPPKNPCVVSMSLESALSDDCRGTSWCCR